MITEELQQLAGLFSRRFFFKALLPTFVFTTFAVSTVAASRWSIEATYTWWRQLDPLTHLLLLLAYSAVVYFLAAAVSSQWRNIVCLLEGYPLKSIANRLKMEWLGQQWHQWRMDQLLSDKEGDPRQAYYHYPHPTESPEERRNEILPA